MSENRQDGWKKLVLSSIQGRPKEWCRNDLRYKTEFRFDTSDINSIRLIETLDELNQFVDDYRESDQRFCNRIDIVDVRKECNRLGCQGQCFNCYGFHINWSRVKSDYKGLALKCYSGDMSHKTKVAELHWTRFDCSSWCFWDTSHLSVIGQSKKTKYKCDGLCKSRYCSIRKNRIS